MAYKAHNNPEGTVKGKWSDESAFNVPLALKEGQRWIEAVTGKKFKSPDFIESTKDGILLCTLLNCIKPGVVPKLNHGARTPFAKRENIQAFLNGCRELHLRDTQLFVTNDLFEGQRIRTVAITLYWLGRAARATPGYKGPQMAISSFTKMKCSRCNKPIDNEDYVVTMNQQWHTACAKCDKCGTGLGNDGYYPDGNKVYCPPCYEGDKSGGPAGKGGAQDSGRSGGPGDGGDNRDKCDACNEPITGKYATVDGKKICEDCLCDNCNHPFNPPNNFKQVNGKKLCPLCCCADCGKSLEKGYIEQPKGSGKNKCLDCANKGRGNKCAHDGCNKPLDSNHPKYHTYCPQHYDEHMCPVCDKELSGPVAECQGKRYHQPCFKCANCSGPFKDGLVFPENGKPYCKDCKNKAKSHGDCAKCNRPVTGNDGIDACGKAWHPQCFSCDNCDKKLPEPNGNYVELNNKPYCTPCASKQGGGPGSGSGGPQGAGSGGYPPGEKCAACKKPLSGQVTNVYSNWFHFGCFKCQDCNKPLTSGYFPFQEMPYCEPCFHNRAGTGNCAKCGKTAEGNLVKLKNMVFHPDCCTCQNCGVNVRQGGGKVFVVNNAPCCGTCHGQMTQPQYAQGNPQVSKSVTTTEYGPRRVGMTYNPFTNKTVYRGAKGQKIQDKRTQKTCPGCKYSADPEDKFCHRCGVAIH